MGQHSAIIAWADLRQLLNLTELARRLNISASAVLQWRVVPRARVGAVSKVTGIPLHRFRPDLYSPPADLMPWQAGNAPGR